jgi:diacylglycerol kinase family enzyme
VPLRVCLIVNPVASGVDARAVRTAREVLSASCEVDLEQTRRRGHARELAVAASRGGADAVIVLAGDGTANEVLNGVTAATPVGVLPAGGTSVLPRALGLPRAIRPAAEVVAAALREGRTRTVTLGTVNGRRFAFAAGVGLDAEAVRRVDAAGRAAGRRPGDVYVARQVARIVLGGRYAHPLLTVEVPPAAPFRGASVLVANVHPWSYAGRLPLKLAPRAEFGLGLDLVVPVEVRVRDVPRWLTYLAWSGGHASGGDPRLRYMHDVADALVRCDEALPVEVDGDDIGDHREVRFGVEREAARLLA